MKRKRMWYAILIIISPAVLFGLYVLGAILFATITDFAPDEKTEVDIEGEGSPISGDRFTVMIWNIGYAGLGADADFFYDGGEMVRSTRDDVQKYMEGIDGFVSSSGREVDFLLLQEVDQDSKRSYHINQYNSFKSSLPNHSASFATNYKVKFIAIPFLEPMGQVWSGLASFSKFKPESATRYQFPGNYSWPKSVFFLDRCFMVQRYKLESGKDLVMINTHNSAYDDGTLKEQQMEFMKSILHEEYDQGNYVIVGGDWNQCPPGFQFDKFAKKPETEYSQTNVPADYIPEWTWAFYPNTPTNRKVSEPYDSDETFTTVIDFFLVSPNIRVISTEGIDLDFAYSDHQPVKLEFVLE